jgi:Domain of unknown function (DUF1899)
VNSTFRIPESAFRQFQLHHGRQIRSRIQVSCVTRQQVLLCRNANREMLGHVYGQSTKKEQCYDNLRISRNAWDTNLVKVSCHLDMLVAIECSCDLRTGQS